MTFGQKLKKLRIEKGFTQDELAEKLYVTRTAISKWETDRGYPSIESLKSIAVFFSVTVDELLASDELLTIAAEDNKQKEKQFRALAYSLLDVGSLLLLFMPFFAENFGGEIRSVSLISVSEIQSYLIFSYWAVVISTALLGIVGLVFGELQNPIWLKSKTNLSLCMGIMAVFLFIISSQPYAAAFSFSILIIKFCLMKK